MESRLNTIKESIESELNSIDEEYTMSITDVFYDVDELLEEENLGDYIMDKYMEFTNNEEIIYYHNAMNYLTEHDTSLHESLELATEYGYETKDLSSEVLATLLYQRVLCGEFCITDFDVLIDLIKEYVELKETMEEEV